jgi:hypothetical protein
MSTSLDRRRSPNTAQAVNVIAQALTEQRAGKIAHIGDLFRARQIAARLDIAGLLALPCDHANLNARWDTAYGFYAECEDCGHRENPEGGQL